MKNIGRMESLKLLRIGCAPYVWGKDKIHARRVVDGCHGCSFEKHEGAKCCEMKAYCMAHCRPDRTPVIFVIE